MYILPKVSNRKDIVNISVWRVETVPHKLSSKIKFSIPWRENRLGEAKKLQSLVVSLQSTHSSTMHQLGWLLRHTWITGRHLDCINWRRRQQQQQQHSRCHNLDILFKY